MNRRAFSLTELILVLLILALAGLFVIPAAGSNATAKADAAANMLRSDMEYAQVQTIANPGNPVVLVLADAGDGWWLADSDSPDTPIERGDSGELYQITLGEGRGAAADGVVIEVEQLPSHILQFDTLGGLEGLAVDPSYRLHCEDAQVQLNVRAGTGFIQIQR
jgi:prepilin-type N-terminal cleavage/methylation domain-containing protein